MANSNFEPTSLPASGNVVFSGASDPSGTVWVTDKDGQIRSFSDMTDEELAAAGWTEHREDDHEH